MNDLFNAIKLFNSSMSDLATNVAVQDAREKVNQINATVTKEGEKRQAMQGLANDLALRLSGAGAPATTIQSAFQAVAPEQYASPEQAQFASTLRESDTLAGAAEQGIAAGQQRARQKGEMDLGFDIARLREKARLDKQLLQEKAQATGTKLNKPTNNMITSLESSDVAKVEAANLLSKMRDRVTTVGPAASRVPGRDLFDKDFAVFQSEVSRFFDAYRKEITGAGASEKELDSLRKSLITGTETPDILMGKLESILKLTERKKATKLKGYKQLKFDVDGSIEGLDQDLLSDWKENPFAKKAADGSTPAPSTSIVPTKRSVPKNWEAGE